MADSGNPTLTNFQNVAENVEDLQFAFAYLNSAGEDNNLSGYMETDGGGKSPSFRYPASYNSPSTAASTDQPHRIRYIRVSIVVRTDQIDLNRVGLANTLAAAAPLFYSQPALENHTTGLGVSDGRARIFLQEVVNVRNLNLPPI